MRVVTIKQPFASNIVRDGKDIENRSWATPYRGPLLIHAGARMHERHLREPREGVVFSAIIGIVDLVDVHDLCDGSCSPWAFSGDVHWRLENPRPFVRPVPCSGALQVWSTDRLQTIVQQEIQHQLAQVGVRA